MTYWERRFINQKAKKKQALEALRAAELTIESQSNQIRNLESEVTRWRRLDPCSEKDHQALLLDLEMEHKLCLKVQEAEEAAFIAGIGPELPGAYDTKASAE